MGNIEELVAKYETLLSKLEEEGHEVTVGETKRNGVLAQEFRGYLDNDATGVRILQKVQKMQQRVGELIAKAYQDV